MGTDRTKRRAIGLLAAGAAGAAAAYCAYTWYTSTAEQLVDEEQRNAEARNEIRQNTESPRSPLPPPAPSEVEEHQEHPQQPTSTLPPPILIDPSSNASTSAMDAEAHLQHHFDSIQHIAVATTLPSLLPLLSRTLFSADGIDDALERLRKARTGVITISPDEKKAIWEALASAALGRLVAATWALPLLTLQTLVQLNILGRHLYLETALGQQDEPLSGFLSGMRGGGGGGNQGWRPTPLSPPPSTAFLPPPHTLPPLSPPSQEAFLSFTEHLTKAGHLPLLAAARDAASAALSGISLDQEIDADSLGHLLSKALELFSQTAMNPSQGLWVEFLLPSPADLREALRVRLPDDRAMLPGSHSFLVDVDAVGAMMDEVACIVSTERFYTVVVAAARHVGKGEAQALLHRFVGVEEGQGQSIPLARLVPAMIAEAKATLAPKGEVVAAVAALPDVASLCATVYSCGPPL